MNTDWGYLSSLWLQRTPDGVARRRHGSADDDDGWLFNQPGFSPYKVDATAKILPSKALRRLKDKAAVISFPTNYHIRDRHFHTLEVTETAVILAHLLGLNADLCEAIAYGHDLGHPPFGHVGERFLSKITGKDFRHEVFSVIIAQQIERQGRGLNLTHQVLNGILYHSRRFNDPIPDDAASPEGNLVMYADKIGYIWLDVEDIFSRTGVKLDDYPEIKKIVTWFGQSQRERQKVCLEALCRESVKKTAVVFNDSEEAQNFFQLKKLMIPIYRQFDFPQPWMLEKTYEFLAKTERDIHPAVVFALLTEHEVARLARTPSLTPYDLESLSVAEILPYLRTQNIDFTKPDMDW